MPEHVKRSLDAILAEHRERGQEVAAAEDEAARADLAASHVRARAESWVTMCPSRFHGVSWEWLGDQHPPEVLDALMRWASLDPRPNLVLLGPVGTGKTGAAILACESDWRRHGQAMEFWPVVELLDGLRPDGGVSLDRLVKVPRAVLDDLGAEKGSEWTQQQLYAVLNRRWLEQRATIVTSNLEPGPLAAAVGERLFSRLMGDGAVVVRLGGRDRRRS